MPTNYLVNYLTKIFPLHSSRKDIYSLKPRPYHRHQDKVVRTRNYQKHILKLGYQDKCKCAVTGETIEHITSRCSALAGEAYFGRQNNVASIILQKLTINHKVLRNSTLHYRYEPKSVQENHQAMLYSETTIIMDIQNLLHRFDYRHSDTYTKFDKKRKRKN